MPRIAEIMAATKTNATTHKTTRAMRHVCGPPSCLISDSEFPGWVEQSQLSGSPTGREHTKSFCQKP